MINTHDVTEYKKGILKIKSKEDRAALANILYKNGYTVRPYRNKKNGKTYEYYVMYEKLPYDENNGECDEG